MRRLGNRLVGQASAVRMASIGMAGEQASVEGINLAHKVYRDGREELIRNAEFGGFAEAAFKDIVAVSEGATVYTTSYSASASRTFSTLGMPSASTRPRISISTPDLLFEELTLRKPTANVPRPPVVARPAFGDDA